MKNFGYCLLFLPLAYGGVIETRPPNNFASFRANSGADSIAQTFLADADTLTSVTFSAFGGQVRLFVSATSGGLPSGPALYVSPLTDLGSSGTVTFTPGLALVPGQTYAVGLDSGILTPGPAADFDIGFRDGDPYAGGTLVQNLNGLGFSEASSLDLALRIEMTNSAVPEPGTAGLLSGAFAVAIAASRLRRR